MEEYFVELRRGDEILESKGVVLTRLWEVLLF